MTLRLSVAVPPLISTQPEEELVVRAGESATLTCSVIAGKVNLSLKPC